MNLEEVARLAGVSRSTVSRVVNDDSQVSESVRLRVQEIIRQHDYHPNAAARSLATRRTRILGLLIPVAAGTIFSDPFLSLLIQTTVDACNTADHHLMLLMDSADNAESSDRLYTRVIRGHHLDGLLIASSVVDDPILPRLQASDFPFVLIGRHPRYREINFVDVDNRPATARAVTHLLDHGYRRIAIINGMSNMISTIDRYAGYVTALQEAGLLPEPDLVAYGHYSQEGGYRAMQALLPQRPDAVFAASDTMAIGALQAIRDAALRVPEDIALIGFDDISAAAYTFPPLSTVAQPVGELGREAVRLLIDRIEHPDQPSQQRWLEAQIVLRRSCGCHMPDAGDLKGGEAGLALAAASGI
jgi:LacI family transcriptional regulator